MAERILTPNDIVVSQKQEFMSGGSAVVSPFEKKLLGLGLPSTNGRGSASDRLRHIETVMRLFDVWIKLDYSVANNLSGNKGDPEIMLARLADEKISAVGHMLKNGQEELMSGRAIDRIYLLKKRLSEEMLSRIRLIGLPEGTMQRQVDYERRRDSVYDSRYFERVLRDLRGQMGAESSIALFGSFAVRNSTPNDIDLRIVVNSLDMQAYERHMQFAVEIKRKHNDHKPTFMLVEREALKPLAFADPSDVFYNTETTVIVNSNLELANNEGRDIFKLVEILLMAEAVRNALSDIDKYEDRVRMRSILNKPFYAWKRLGRLFPKAEPGDRPEKNVLFATEQNAILDNLAQANCSMQTVLATFAYQIESMLLEQQ